MARMSDVSAKCAQYVLCAVCGSALQLWHQGRVPSQDESIHDILTKVERSKVVVLLLTKNVLSRPWCLIELFWAIKEGVPLVRPWGPILSHSTACRVDLCRTFDRPS